MKVGDLVRVKWSAARDGDYDLGDIPCIIYSIHHGACKVYDPFDRSFRTMIVDRIELINEC